MKTLSTSLKAIVIASLTCAAGFASAADTQSLTVTATVKKVCLFTNTAGQILTFGELNPSVGGNVSGTGATVTYRCTKGTSPVTVTVGTGLNTANQMKDTVSGDLIPYTLTAAADPKSPTGFTAGTASAVTFTSNVSSADYLDKSAGSYSDTVVLTLSP